jgi:hypothetical protein
MNILKQKWAVWQLADDEKTYGLHAGMFIITSEDGEEEVTGVAISEKVAKHIVKLHNKSLEAK